MELQQERDHFRLFSAVFRPFSAVFRPSILIVRKEIFAPYKECIRYEKEKRTTCKSLLKIKTIL